MGNLRTILLEGLFYTQEGKLTTGHGDFLIDHLEPLIGQEIHLAIHFLPPNPPEMDRWGGGCCMWQPAPCPAGHHEHPDRLLNVAVQGVLGRDTTTDRWWIDQFDGKQVVIPFILLDGHHGRVAAASVFDVQKMQESLSDITPESLETLSIRATSLRDMLDQLRKHTGVE
jgi:hypothetical protein